MSFSRKQELNTASSNKAELIGIVNTFMLLMWIKHFIEHNADGRLIVCS